MAVATHRPGKIVRASPAQLKRYFELKLALAASYHPPVVALTTVQNSGILIVWKPYLEAEPAGGTDGHPCDGFA